VFCKGAGALLTDVDGNEYIDYACADGALILGHADERIVAAISKAASKGWRFSGVTERDVRLAELIASRFSVIDVVQFVSSREGALELAIELARAHTGRQRAVIVDGLFPEGQERASRGADGLGSGAGTAETLTIAYNDVDAVERTFADGHGAIAAVLVEPVASRCGVVMPAAGFLERLRLLCDEHGAVLVFDEACSGLRAGSGGATMLYGVSPELVCLGTALACGLPIAACCGRKEIMKHASTLAAAGRNVQWSHDLIAMAAGTALLQALGEPGFYDGLEAAAARLDAGLRAASRAAGVACYHTRIASLLGLFFTDESVVDSHAARRCDAGASARFGRAMLERGVYVPPSPNTVMFVSAAHTEEQIDRTIEASHEAMNAVRDETDV